MITVEEITDLSRGILVLNPIHNILQEDKRDIPSQTVPNPSQKLRQYYDESKHSDEDANMLKVDVNVNVNVRQNSSPKRIKAPISWTVPTSEENKNREPYLPKTEQHATIPSSSRPTSASRLQKPFQQSPRQEPGIKSNPEQNETKSNVIPEDRLGWNKEGKGDINTIRSSPYKQTIIEIDNMSYISKDSHQKSKHSEKSEIPRSTRSLSNTGPIRNTLSSKSKGSSSSYSSDIVPGKVWKGKEIFLVSAPLRCLSVIEINNPLHVDIAVGSNSKSVHVLRCHLKGQRRMTLIAFAVNLLFIEYVDNQSEQLQEFVDVHRGSIYAMDNLPSHRTLATASNDKALRLWK